MREAFESLCKTKMESISFVHLGAAVMNITGKFSFLIDSVKKVDRVLNIWKYAEDSELHFTV